MKLDVANFFLINNLTCVVSTPSGLRHYFTARRRYHNTTTDSGVPTRPQANGKISRVAIEAGRSEASNQNNNNNNNNIIIIVVLVAINNDRQGGRGVVLR